VAYERLEMIPNPAEVRVTLHEETRLPRRCGRLLNAGRLQEKIIWVVGPAYVMGSIGEEGVPRASIALPASKHKSSR
jgi:hypothetical protein